MQTIPSFPRAPARRWFPALGILATGAAKAREAAPGEALVLPQLAVEGAHAPYSARVAADVTPTGAAGTKTKTAQSARSGGASCARGIGRSIYASLGYRW